MERAQTWESFFCCCPDRTHWNVCNQPWGKKDVVSQLGNSAALDCSLYSQQLLVELNTSVWQEGVEKSCTDWISVKINDPSRARLEYSKLLRAWADPIMDFDFVSEPSQASQTWFFMARASSSSDELGTLCITQVTQVKQVTILCGVILISLCKFLAKVISV